VVPENFHTSPTEGIFSYTSPSLWKFQLSFIHFFKFFGLIEPPTPQEIPIPSVGGVWIFSGTTHYYLNYSRRANNLTQQPIRTTTRFSGSDVTGQHYHPVLSDAYLQRLARGGGG